MSQLDNQMHPKACACVFVILSWTVFYTVNSPLNQFNSHILGSTLSINLKNNYSRVQIPHSRSPIVLCISKHRKVNDSSHLSHEATYYLQLIDMTSVYRSRPDHHILWITGYIIVGCKNLSP